MVGKREDPGLPQSVWGGLTLHQKLILGLMAVLFLLGGSLAAWRKVQAQSRRMAAVEALDRAGVLAGQTPPGKIAVQIEGGVERPGVYEVALGSKLHYLIDLAGGLTLDASADSLNLARALNDGEKIIVPRETLSAGTALSGGEGLASGEAMKDGPLDPLKSGDGVSPPEPIGAAGSPVVDLNRATLEELDALPGIGPTLAARIVELRAKRGRFKTVEEIMLVEGIGTAKFERIKPNLVAGPAAP